jgi:hypothetical protein
MGYQQRKDLIAQLEHIRGSKLLCYVLSDRETFPPSIPGFATQLSSEPHLLFIDQLRAIGKIKQLDIFLYTRGGATDAVWPFINLLREYGKRLTVIVPFRAHSAGTLICLGADEVIMSDSAELSPIDPTTGNQFNPSDPASPQNRFGISVEDVVAYFKLGEERANIKQESSRLEILKELTQKVHPLALGNVQRVYMQIRLLAHKLLELHINDNEGKAKIDPIIKALTEELYSHVHSVSRREAITLMGDWVRAPSKDEAPLIWDLFNSYSEAINLRQKFQLPEFMGDNQTSDLSVVGGFIESMEISHIYTTDLKLIQRPNLPPNVQMQIAPGAPIPLVPGFSRSYEFSPQRMGWKINERGD